MNPRIVGFFLVAGVAAFAWLLTYAAWQLSEEVDRTAPLDPVSFPQLTLVTAGTGGAHENPDRRGPATAVGMGDGVWLVDAGRAAADALRLAGIPPSQPDTVLLTSLLSENTIGLDDLLFGGWLAGRDAPVRLVGPPGTVALARALEASARPGIEARARALGESAEAVRFDAVEIGDGWSETAGALTVRAGEIPGGPLTALAYRFEASGRSAVVGGAGWAPDALAAFARGANLLAHGAIYPMTPQLAEELGLPEDEARRLERETALHTSIESVGGIARRAGVETLVLVRLRPPPVYDFQLTGVVGKTFDGRLVIAEDGEWIRP